MYKPKKFVRLSQITGLPKVADVRRLLAEADKARGCTVELPWQSSKTGGLFSLTVRVDLGGKQPVYTLYEGQGTSSRVMWSSPFEDFDLLYDVMCLSLPAEGHTSFNQPEPAAQGPERSKRTIDDSFLPPMPRPADSDAAAFYNSNSGFELLKPEPLPPKAEPKPEPEPVAAAAAAAASSQSAGQTASQSAGQASGQTTGQTTAQTAAGASPVPVPVPVPIPAQGAPAAQVAQAAQAAAAVPAADVANAQAQPGNYAYPPSYGYQPPPGYPPLPYGYYPGYGYPPPPGYAYPPGYPPAQTVPVQPGAAYVPPGYPPPPAPVIDASLINKRPNILLGNFLVEAGLIPEATLNAALNLQGMVKSGALTTSQAAEAVKRAHERGGELDKAAFSPSQPGPDAKEAKSAPPLGQILVEAGLITVSILNAALNLQEVVRTGSMSKESAIDAFVAEHFGKAGKHGTYEPVETQRAIDLCKKAALFQENDFQAAVEVKKKHGGEVAKILSAAGKLDAITWEAALKCVSLIEQNRLKDEQAVIALMYCQRSRVSFDEAVEEMGWQKP